MDEIERETDGSWVPSSCTLPNAEQPLRLAEFDAFFASDVTGVEDLAGGVRLRLVPDDRVAVRASSLAARETQCCSFFTFTLTATGSELVLDITAPDARSDVVGEIATRARAARS